MLGRRKFLGAVGAAAVLAGGVRAVGGAGMAASLGEDLLESIGVRPRAVFGRCQVTRVNRTPDGGASVGMTDSAGQHFELELRGHDPRAPGVASAGSLAVYVKNQGRGTATTVEEHGLAAMALARHLERHEAAGARLPRLPTLGTV